MEPIERIHHISVTVGDPNENLHFYRDILGLRLVKQTVNFEDDGGYHLYFSNQNVDAGSIITFFPRVDNLHGRTGAGQVRRIAFSIPNGSIQVWEKQLTKHAIAFKNDRIFNKPALLFKDSHGSYLALVETGVEKENEQILGFHGVELLSENPSATLELLTQKMGLKHMDTTDEYFHLEMIGEEKHQVLIHRTLTERGRLGIGTVHHIAWSIPTIDKLRQWKEMLEETRNLTAIHDRKYFKSTYFRDPGRIIYELATAGPGFMVDEPFEHLGTTLMLPEEFEIQREEIEKKLPKLNL